MITWPDIPTGGFTSAWAPDNGPAITAAVLSQLQDGQAKGATLFSSQYSITDKPIAQQMAVMGKANPANRYLFDSSEYQDETEKPIVQALIAQLQPIQWGIGTAPDGEDILHSKILALLYLDGTGWTFSGSFNLSASAEREFNLAHFIWSRALAESMAGQIQQKLTWVQQNQPQPPTGRPRSSVDTDAEPG